MATIYTYDQFEQAAKQAGLFDKFSEADLNLARQNADAGMSILKYKQDWNNATTDEARALANLGAEQIRSSYGNYTGGGDGGSFHLNPMSPSSFGSEPAKQYENKYDGQIRDLYEQQKNYGDFGFEQPAPEYESRYDDQTQQLINTLLSREQFSWDPAADQNVQAYQKQYTREGKRATQDALAAASLATGGAPSSYAIGAATQAGDYYAALMADKMPELYQQAYSRYLDEYNMQMQNLGMLQTQEQLDYGKFQDKLNQWNTDRNFEYGKWQDGYDRLNTDLQTGIALEQQDYQKFLQEQNQQNIDREFEYGQLLDELDSQRVQRQEEMDKAQLAGNYGDYSFLNDLGIDTSNNSADWERKYQMALLKAEMGDYSGLQELGVDTSNNPADWERKYQMALLKAEMGDYSGLQELGVDTSKNPADWERQYQMALLKAQYGDYSGLRELGVNIPEEKGSTGGGYWGGPTGDDTGDPGNDEQERQEALLLAEAMKPDGLVSQETVNELLAQMPMLNQQDLEDLGYKITKPSQKKGNPKSSQDNRFM